MFVVCVTVHVKPEHREAFIAATRKNADNTLREPGNLRFDVIQQIDDPNRFLLYEVYHSDAGFADHQQTPHYRRWREVVADWMAEPRQAVKGNSLFPEDPASWQARPET